VVNGEWRIGGLPRSSSVPAMLQLDSFAGERSPPTGFSEKGFTVPRGERSGCGVLALGWLVNAVATVAASRLRNWRGKTRAESRGRGPAPVQQRPPAAPVAQGPLKIMERQAGRQAGGQASKQAEKLEPQAGAG
jgi:hypothetical protein